jgi:transcriptional regulator with XRE-family HTH domain
LSVRGLAKRVGISPSQVSAVELGKSQPSAATLYAIAAELDLSIDDLIFRDRQTAPGRANSGDFGQSPASSGPVLRHENRAEITLDTGVVWQRLTPDSEPGVEFLHTTYDVGCSSGNNGEMARHAGHEWGLVLSGRLEVHIGFERYELGPGDSISFESTTPHHFRNAGEEPVNAVWFVAGRNRASVPPPIASSSSPSPSGEDDED